MLQSLSIRNVVLIDKLDLDFKSGLSVLTGETGAGKSILLDSLGLVLGNRAETSLIRQGEDKLSVTAQFSLQKQTPALRALLDEYEIEADDELLIKRSLTRDGKGKIFINDQPAGAKLLKEIGKYLVEVHGQFDNQGLLNPANHLDVLDAYGAYKPLVERTAAAFAAYKKARAARQEAEKNIARAKEDEENLRHWVDELEKMNPRPDEEDELGKKRQEMMNAEKIIDSLNYAYGALTERADVQGAIRSAQSAMDKANTLVDGRYQTIIDMLDQALIDISETVNELEEVSHNVSLNQNELENIEERLYALRGLARKHNVAVSDLPQTLADFRNRLSTIELGEEGIAALRKAEDTAKLDYVKAANELSSARQAAALQLDNKVMSELPPLKMEKARFVTVVEKMDESGWSEKGFNNVYFTVATNPNSPQGPLNKIASGGELARFMLALKVNLAQSSSVATMIFDEVDAGVGGATAQAVGERLARLARDVQVLVVTHSPQVAACGNNHFKVEKSTADNVTTTTVRELTKIEKSEEIARMLAGEVITDAARAAAKVLIGAE
ncbi:MAG TPA: DNA repair protein RecN [Candidatus Scatocola faecipullorum]|uniref:DNA repair protein RecN n=1 Tax=Candidatus Scatocola faecipullorum TaxID=2840917 RepID=A0A9D1M5T0_9PROT|nr:DNA repair protein RecN [Candidatus Scatocola faecipullorum]